MEAFPLCRYFLSNPPQGISEFQDMISADFADASSFAKAEET